MDNSEMAQRVATVEEKSKAHDKRIDSLENKSEKIPELSTLMKMVIDTNNKQSDTLDKVNDNLTRLNGKMDSIDVRVGDLEQGKKATKKLTTDLILKIVGGLILAYLVIALNLR